MLEVYAFCAFISSVKLGAVLCIQVVFPWPKSCVTKHKVSFLLSLNMSFLLEQKSCYQNKHYRRSDCTMTCIILHHTLFSFDKCIKLCSPYFSQGAELFQLLQNVLCVSYQLLLPVNSCSDFCYPVHFTYSRT